jgi:hypothetical protein
MFTYRDFEGGTLGLAWTGDLKNAGGVCEKNGVGSIDISFMSQQELEVWINLAIAQSLQMWSKCGKKQQSVDQNISLVVVWSLSFVQAVFCFAKFAAFVSGWIEHSVSIPSERVLLRDHSMRVGLTWLSPIGFSPIFKSGLPTTV